MNINPYLHFSGNCAEAMAFYQDVLGAKLRMMMKYGDAPPDAQGPPGSEHLVMHASLDIGGTILMASDEPPGRAQPAQGFTVSLNTADPAEADTVYAALSEGGVVHMPMAETFWADRFAMFADKFGTPWMINCEKTG